MLWCYVMGIPKYSQIAVELLRRIRSGVYQDKLPPMRELACEFDSAMQTVFNAVQLLVRKELLVPCGSGGMNIDRSKLPCGLIAIVLHNAMLPRVAAFEPLAQAISDDGFLPVYLGVLRKQSLYTTKKLFQADISGVMFFLQYHKSGVLRSVGFAENTLCIGQYPARSSACEFCGEQHL